MYITADTQTYCVLGNPIKHSLSPILHTFMFEYYGINAVYVAFEVEDVKNAINGIRALGIKGVNVTLPFKEKVFDLVDDCDGDVQFLKSVNTIKNENGRLVGYNTDYLGFMDMFNEYVKFSSDEDRIVVLGAGGVAKSVVYALYKLGINRVFVLNRSIERAEELKDRFKEKLDIVVGSLENKEIISTADVIINCTSVGLSDDEIPIELNWVENPIVMDVIYYDTPLIKKARQLGLTAVNGLDMFIGQAYYAFKIWTGIEFDRDTAKKLIEDVMA